MTARSTLLSKWLLIGHACRMGDVTKADTAVLWVIAERYNDEQGFAWPSLQAIARDARLGLRTVDRSLQRLASLGLIEIEPGTRVRSNRYRPSFHLGTGLDGGTVTQAGTGLRDGDVPVCVTVQVPVQMTHKPSHSPASKPERREGGAGAAVAADAAPAPAPGWKSMVHGSQDKWREMSESRTRQVSAKQWARWAQQAADAHAAGCDIDAGLERMCESRYQHCLKLFEVRDATVQKPARSHRTRAKAPDIRQNADKTPEDYTTLRGVNYGS